MEQLLATSPRDSLEDDALLAYDPYRASSVAARLRLASQEMTQSRYDSNHSGHCDSPVCQHVVALTIVGGRHPAAFGTIVRDDLAQIGIDLDMRDVPGRTFFQTIDDPTARTPMAIGSGWRKDYPNGSDFFTQLFTNDAIAGGGGFSLLGATPAELQKWGYTVSSVPSVDDRIDLCLPLVGGAQGRCWAALDQYLKEKVVAVLPIVTEGTSRSSRHASLRIRSIRRSTSLRSTGLLLPPKTDCPSERWKRVRTFRTASRPSSITTSAGWGRECVNPSLRHDTGWGERFEPLLVLTLDQPIRA